MDLGKFYIENTTVRKLIIEADGGTCKFKIFPIEAMSERLAKQSLATKDLNLLKTGGAVAEKMSKLDTLMDGCFDFKRILSPSSGDNNSIVVGKGMEVPRNGSTGF
ncbi:hypothetical protein CEXT_448321 [Caerostris extrusa]|uniref:Uncharacterized protein n=1 Tax=Caerostris extrusa TaxID=172846 RepID=A0AAV4XK50_CAEEX|nr:hypothetical protein CEXT_448321 [Caerostris extrusa]